jgi:hypothetical protein
MAGLLGNYTTDNRFAIQGNMERDAIGVHCPPPLNSENESEIRSRDNFDVLG